MSVEQAPLTQPGPSLEERFANYAEHAHPEIEEGVPRETTPVTPVEPTAPESPVVEAPAEPTEPEAPVRFEFETLDELAKRLEVPIDTLLALKAQTEVDSVKRLLTLAEIQKGYQLDQHNTNKSKELSALQQKADATRAQYEAYNAQAKQQTDNLNALGKYAQDMLNLEFQGVNWQQLQVQDPIGYITAWQNYSDRQTQINNYVAQVNQQSQSQQAQVQTHRQAQIQEVLKNRASIRPEWADEKSFNDDTNAIRDAFLSNGFKAEELPMLLTNPAYLKMADAATRWMNLQKQKPEVTAKVRTAPQLVKGNARTNAVKSSNLANFKAQQKANPKDSDIAEAAFAEWADTAIKSGLL